MIELYAAVLVAIIIVGTVLALRYLSKVPQMTEIKPTLEQLKADYDTVMEAVGGCGDGSCLICPPKGLHTNAGCRCPRHRSDLELRRLLSAAARLRKGLDKLSEDE